ncbi:MAG: hypothetical protein V3V31_06760 [Methylococcales bacterium]
MLEKRGSNQYRIGFIDDYWNNTRPVQIADATSKPTYPNPNILTTVRMLGLVSSPT